MFPQRHLARTFGAMTSVWGVATVLGPLVGGAFAEGAHWRELFWAFAAQCGLFMAAAVWLLPADAPPDIAGLVGQYAHGNEPSHHIAYLYVYAGVPHKTQARVRNLLETMYAPTPDGMQGNEDVGQMSAWYVLSALGFYPVDPVSGVYIVGSPLFDHATVELGAGKKLEIEVRRKNPTDQYVQSFSLNGKPQEKAWFRHGDIAQGGKLILEMGPEPNNALGSDVAAAPPSLTL